MEENTTQPTPGKTWWEGACDTAASAWDGTCGAAKTAVDASGKFAGDAINAAKPYALPAFVITIVVASAVVGAITGAKVKS